MKKSIMLSMVLLVAALFMIQVVSAATIESLGTLTGSSNRRSNPDADDDDDQNLYSGLESFTIQSSEAVSGVTLTSTCDVSKYNVTFDKTGTFNLAAGANTVTVKARVPEDLTSFDDSNPEGNYPKVNDDREVKVCDIQLKNASSNVIATAPLYMEAKNYLEISKVEIYVNENRLESFSSDGKSTDALKPGDTVTLNIVVENKYKDSDPEDLEFQDINVRAYVDSTDLDVDEDDEIDSIDSNSEEEIELEFDIDEDIDGDDYKLYIIVAGEDENGAMQGEIWELTLEINRESHEIAIVGVDAPTTLTCSDTSFKVSVDLRNTGKKDEKYAAIRVSSTDFDFTEKRDELDMDKNDETTETFTISIPETITKGNRVVNIETFYSRTTESDQEAVIIEYPACNVCVPACSGKVCGSDGCGGVCGTCDSDETCEDGECEAKVDVIIDQEEEDEEPIIPGTTPITSEDSFFDSTVYMVILIVAIVVIIGLIIGLGVAISKRNNE